jgi:hypothetical protein
MIFWAARWIDQGCPRVVFDNNYASLLMATDVGKDLTDKVVFPWKAFLIELAEGTLSFRDGEGNPHPVQKIFVQVMNPEGEDKFNIVAMARNGLQLWRHGSRINELTISKTSRDRVWDIGYKTDSRDDRVLNLIGRLVISMCVAMSDPDNFRKQTPSRKNKIKHRLSKQPALPEIQTFIIGKPTKLNCRPALTDYIEGTRRGPTVRFLVRGHWKLQAYGPGRTKRKLIQIEPYWKGPEEAKILTRTVLMGEQE